MGRKSYLIKVILVCILAIKGFCCFGQYDTFKLVKCQCGTEVQKIIIQDLKMIKSEAQLEEWILRKRNIFKDISAFLIIDSQNNLYGILKSEFKRYIPAVSKSGKNDKKTESELDIEVEQRILSNLNYLPEMNRHCNSLIIGIIQFSIEELGLSGMATIQRHYNRILNAFEANGIFLDKEC